MRKVAYTWIFNNAAAATAAAAEDYNDPPQPQLVNG